jgi:hypothetical protein
MSSEYPDFETTETTGHDEMNPILHSLNSKDAMHLPFDVKCRLECLVYDLQRFKSDPGVMSRVEKANLYPFCFGPPYLSQAAGEALLNLTLSNNSTVQECLSGIAGGKGYYVCTSHTLAPALVHLDIVETWLRWRNRCVRINQRKVSKQRTRVGPSA